jgi:hypothetical protein
MEFANLRAQILNSRANIMAQGLMDERLLKAQQEIEAARLKQYNMYGGQETGTTLPIQGALPKAAYNSPLVVVGPDGKRYMKQFNPTTNDYEYVPI